MAQKLPLDVGSSCCALAAQSGGVGSRVQRCAGRLHSSHPLLTALPPALTIALPAVWHFAGPALAANQAQPILAAGYFAGKVLAGGSASGACRTGPVLRHKEAGAVAAGVVVALQGSVQGAGQRRKHVAG